MTNEQLGKIKQCIDLSALTDFRAEDFAYNGFVPINKKDGQYYFAVLKNADRAAIKLQTGEHLNPHTSKFIVVDDGAFKDLISFASSKINTISSTPAVIDESLKDIPPNPSPKKKIGEILIDMGMITEEQLFEALVEAKKTSLPIGSILVQKGFVSLVDLKSALSKQQGIESVNTDQLKIDENVLSIIPEDFIRLNSVIPLSFDGKTLVVGMVYPNDKHVLNDIVYLTGLRPRVMIITSYEFNMCLQTYYNESKKETTQFIQTIEKETVEYGTEETLWERAERELQDTSSSVVKFVNKLITDAIELKASDIHIEPRLEYFAVRYRIDGILKEVLRLPSRTESAILTRLKVISKMNIAEHRRPQDGSFTIKYKNQSYDFRINTLPVASKEKMVIRVLTPAVSMETAKKDIELVGATVEDIERITRIKSVPNGIILATGPTGSGKTTTLYSLLTNINDEKINITTIEDPVEIKIEGVNQSQINAKAGITFASCLRAILRQDPDVILVGEIRDYETLEVAISAALTGHLVLSTLHTNSAASTITRLIEMGAKDYLVSSTLAGIVAQRLVRKLCPQCREEYYVTREEAELVVVNPEEVEKFMKIPIYKPKGCEKCGMQGYKGRLGVYEIMQITKEIKRLIAQGAHDIQIEEAAIGSGMKTLQQACLGHILRGETSISEFVRVLGPVNE